MVALGTLLFVLPASAARRHASTAVVTGVLNLNQASAAQLDLLPGVGTKAAHSILDYRAKHPFGRPEELVKVKGFGKKRYERLRPFLAVQGPTTLKRSSPYRVGAAQAGPHHT